MILFQFIMKNNADQGLLKKTKKQNKKKKPKKTQNTFVGPLISMQKATSSTLSTARQIPESAFLHQTQPGISCLLWSGIPMTYSSAL